MIVSGYYGKLIVTGDLTPRWSCWFLCFFLDIVYQLLLSLSNATNQESDPGKMDKDELKTKMLVQTAAWQRFWGSCQPPGDPRGQI